MFFSITRSSRIAAILLLPIYVQAVAFSVDSFEGIAVGKPMKLNWWGNKTPVTIKLLQGPPEALEVVVTVASNIAGDSYTWTPTTIPAGTYVLSITQGAETNYSPQFAVASTFTAAPTPTPTPTPTPSSAGTKPLTKAIAAAALPGATGHILQSAVIAAYYLPAGYSNGSRSICTSNVSGNTISTALPCASSVGSNLGHYKGGAGQMDVAIGAAVAGMAFAVILVL